MTSIYSVILILTIFLASVGVNADAQKIESFENEIVSLQQEIKNNDANIAAYESKLSKVAAELEQAQANLAKANIEFRTTSIKNDNNPTPENARALRNTGDAKNLAERIVNSKQKRTDWLTNEISLLSAESDQFKESISETNTKIAKAKAEWKNKVQQQAALKPAPQAPTLPEPSAETSTELATESAPETQAAMTTATESPASNPEPEAVDSIAQLPALTPKPTLQKIDEINRYLSGDVSQDREISPFLGYSDKSGRIKFVHLGGEIYIGEAKLKKGKQQIKYAGSSFRVEIPKINDKKVHVIYFDNRDAEKRKIVVIEKSAVN